MKILITGASGFLGQHLAEKLCSLGHQLTTFGRTPSLPDRLAPLPIHHIQGDICDLSSCLSAIGNQDTVYHLAGLVSYRRRDYDLLYKTNVIGTSNVMQACLKHDIARVIHMSSIAGMGIPPEGQIADESIVYNLQGKGLHYCDTKYAGEQAVHSLIAKGLPAIIVSPGITFGEGDTHPHHHTIFKSMVQGWLIGYPVGGVMFSDIEDVVNSCINALTRGRIAERYILGSANMTFQEAATTLAAVLGGKAPAFPIPGAISELAGNLCESLFPLFNLKPKLTRQVAWLSQRKIFFSSDKAKAELQHTQTPFIETVRRTAPYYLGQIKKNARC